LATFDSINPVSSATPALPWVLPPPITPTRSLGRINAGFGS
jgi:hypothetical protein